MSLECLEARDVPAVLSDLSPDQEFVSGLYREALGREADLEGLLGWAGLLEGGALTRDEVARGIREGDEARQLLGLTDPPAPPDPTPERALVIALYRDVLGREPDLEGLLGWTGLLEGGALAPDEVTRAFRESDEARARGDLDPVPPADPPPADDGTGAKGDPAEPPVAPPPDKGERPGEDPNGIQAFVSGLYRKVLGREPDAEGLLGWTGLLEGGALAPDEVTRAFRESDEARARDERGPRTGGVADPDTPPLLDPAENE